MKTFFLSLAAFLCSAQMVLAAPTVTVSWVDGCTGETEIEVHRQILGSSGYAKIATVSANTTTWIDTSPLMSPNQSCYKERCVYGPIGGPYTETSAFNTPACVTVTNMVGQPGAQTLTINP